MSGARSSLGCILLALTALASDPPAIHFDNFAASPDLSLVGDAFVPGQTLRLTPAKSDRSGAVWFRRKQPVASGFETRFQFQLTKQGGLGGGADGFAFVLQNAGPDALGGRGSAGGFAVTDPAYRRTEAAIPWSIAVFFDTFKNPGDPSDNFVSFCTYGRASQSRWPAPRLAFTKRLSTRLRDRRVHTVRILFEPPALSVFMDDSPNPVLQAPVDLSILLDPQGRAWVGFTASTGGGYQNHDILKWSFSSVDVSSNITAVSSEISFPMSDCLPGRNLCTPERAFVEPRGAGYHIVLPANLEWGASIPNPSGREVRVTNAKGIACWDFQAQGSSGCSGPAGNTSPMPAGADFLAAASPPGALITLNRDGSTWFSVNAHPGAAFEDNEGFYEFDVDGN